MAHEGGQRVAIRAVGNIASLQVFFEQQVAYRIDGVLAAQGCNGFYGQALVHMVLRPLEVCEPYIVPRRTTWLHLLTKALACVL